MALAIVHGALVFGFTMRILLRDDLSPPARLAWFVVINLAPYFGVLIYFLFGEIDLGQKARKRHDEIFAMIRAHAAPYMGRCEDVNTLIDPLYRPAFLYGGSINGFYPMGGNRAELLEDAAAFATRLVADIDAAQTHVHVLYYIWLEDQTGTEVARALTRAAQRGVTCRAIADGLGSRGLIRSRLWKDMKVAGVDLAVAFPLDNPFLTMLTSRIDLRNHRKITVIDGHITYCGSQNSADPEFHIKPRYAPWVDIMMRFEGPVVAQNQLLFASDWMQARGEILDGIELKAQPVEGGFPAQVVGDGPTERRSATPQLFTTLIASARQEMILTTPYFVPDATVLDALIAAAHRGVRVGLVFPKKNDSWIVAAASRSYYRRLLEAGCVIHEFTGGLLHAKTLTIDGRVALIGSSNLDLRSFELNYENNILFQDETLTDEIRTRQASYIAQSEAVSSQEVAQWPFYVCIWNNAVATVGPIL
nr:cardiolipin synthase [Rhodovulum imhoffii]